MRTGAKMTPAQTDQATHSRLHQNPAVTILHNHDITVEDIAAQAGVSNSLASMVLAGRRSDRRGIIAAALSLLPNATASEAFLEALP